MGNEKKKGKKLCPPSTVVSDSVPTVVVVEKVAKESSKNEIDAIFGGKKRKKEVGTAGSGEDQKSGAAAAAGAAEIENSDVREVRSRKKKKTKTKKTAGKSLEPVEKSSGLSRKKTDDGLPVYSEAELGFNKKEAGGTPLCPFDCECCFWKLWELDDFILFLVSLLPQIGRKFDPIFASVFSLSLPKKNSCKRWVALVGVNHKG